MVLANLKSNDECCQKIIIIFLEKITEEFGYFKKSRYICRVIKEMKSVDADSNLKSNGDCCQKKIKKFLKNLEKQNIFVIFVM